MAENGMPRLIALLVCRRAALEDGATKTLYEIWDKATMKEFPAIVPLVVFVKWRFDVPAKAARLVLRDGQSAEELGSADLFDLSTSSSRVFDVANELTFTFPHPGLYELDLTVDGQPLGSYPIELTGLGR